MANNYQHGGNCNKRFCHQPHYMGSRQYGGVEPIKETTGTTGETRRYQPAPRRPAVEPLETGETMRKIEEAMNRALVQGRDFKRDNTRVEWVRHDNGDLHSASIYLHGHKIGWYYYSGTEQSWMLMLEDANWQTPTTKSRLNALLSEMAEERTYVFQQDFQWFLVQKDGVPRNWGGTHSFAAHPPAGYTNKRRIA